MVATAASQVARLAQELRAQPDSTRANHAARIIKLLSVCEDDEAITCAAVQSLKLFFLTARQERDESRPSKRLKATAVVDAEGAAAEENPEEVYRRWLTKQSALFTSAMFRLLATPSASAPVQVAAASALLEAVRSEQGTGVFAVALFQRLLTAVIEGSAVKPEVLALLFSKHMHFADVRYFTLVCIKALAEKHRSREAAAVKPSTFGPALELDDIVRNLMDALCAVSPEAPGAEGDELRSWCGLAEVGAVAAAVDKNDPSRMRKKRRGEVAATAAAAAAAAGGGTNGSDAGGEQHALWANPKAQKRLFSEAWLAFLQLPVPRDIYRKVLLRLHTGVLPHMTNPLLLSDFLTASIDQGGLTGMLALHGLFLLVTQHGLEYSAFFRRLYGLLTPRAFVAAQRAQFFRLVDVFLASGLVPAYTAAAFAKRFARLALTAPPAGAMIAIAFIHNILRRHPSCSVLLHRPGPRICSAEQGEDDDVGSGVGDGAPAALAGSGADPFDEREEDPAKSRGVESSLWELHALRNHYCAQVAAFTSILDKDLTDRIKTSEVDLAPLLSASYASLIEAEANRRVKAAPVAFYKTAPTRLFDACSNADFAGWSTLQA